MEAHSSDNDADIKLVRNVLASVMVIRAVIVVKKSRTDMDSLVVGLKIVPTSEKVVTSAVGAV